MFSFLLYGASFGFGCGMGLSIGLATGWIIADYIHSARGPR